MSEEYPQLLGAYVPSTQDIVLHIPKALWETLPREAQEEGPVGELLAAVWATPGLEAVLGEKEEQPSPEPQTDTPPPPQPDQPPEASTEEEPSDAPA